MCDPVTLATIGTTVMSAISSAGAAVGIGGTAAAAAGGTALASTTAAVGTAAAAAGLEGASIPLAAAAAEGTSTLGILSTAASIGSGLIGAVGSIQQAQAQAAAAKFNADIAKQNAAVARENANIAGQAGEQQAFNVGLKARQLIGSLKTNEAAGGVDVNQGSAVDVRSSAAEMGQLDALTVRSNATREAYGYSQQARSFEDQAMLDTFEAKNDTSAGYVNAASTILGSAGSATENYLRYQMAGGFSA